MTAEERKTHIQTLAGFPARLEKLLSGLDDKQLDTPYREGGWTVRQVVHHLADSHANGYIRFRNALSEDKPIIKSYNQDSYAQHPDYTALPLEPSLEILRGLHRRLAFLLENIKADDWQRQTDDPERGQISIDDLLQSYSEHCDLHYGHIRGLIESRGWKSL